MATIVYKQVVVSVFFIGVLSYFEIKYRVFLLCNLMNNIIYSSSLISYCIIV